MNLSHPNAYNPLLWQAPRFLPHPSNVHPAFLHHPGNSADKACLDPRFSLGIISDAQRFQNKSASFTIDAILGHQQNKQMRDQQAENNNQVNFKEMEKSYEAAVQLKQRMKKRKLSHKEDDSVERSHGNGHGSVRHLLQYQPSDQTSAIGDFINERNSLSDSSAACKGKRVRTIFTPEQLERLEAIFQKQQYMVGTERYYLALSLQLSEAQVKVWFQNRRIKWRKHQFEADHRRLGNNGDMFQADAGGLGQLSPGSGSRGELSPTNFGEGYHVSAASAVAMSSERGVENGGISSMGDFNVSAPMGFARAQPREYYMGNLLDKQSALKIRVDFAQEGRNMSPSFTHTGDLCLKQNDIEVSPTRNTALGHDNLHKMKAEPTEERNKSDIHKSVSNIHIDENSDIETRNATGLEFPAQEPSSTYRQTDSGRNSGIINSQNLDAKMNQDHSDTSENMNKGRDINPSQKSTLTSEENPGVFPFLSRHSGICLQPFDDSKCGEL